MVGPLQVLWEVFIRMDLGLLVIIAGALNVHLCLNSTLLLSQKVHLRFKPYAFDFLVLFVKLKCEYQQQVRAYEAYA